MYLGTSGMVCSVGLTAASACAAMRAGIAKFDELPYLDNLGEPIIGATVAGLDVHLRRKNRTLQILVSAIRNCLSANHSFELENIPLLVCVAGPETRNGSACDTHSMLAETQLKLGVRFHPELSQAVTKGHTAGFEALQITRRLLQYRNVEACLVCGVDSFCNANSLLWLEENERLKTRHNSNGVIPGEAGAAIFVHRQPPSTTEPAVHISGLGFAFESANLLSEEPLQGIGLAQAARAALSEAGLGMHEIDFRLADVTGENYGFREQSLALARVMRIIRQQLPVWHCADSIGDTGAAAGVCQLVIASHAFTKGYALGDRAACFCSAVLGDRAVAVVQRVTPKR